MRKACPHTALPDVVFYIRPRFAAVLSRFNWSALLVLPIAFVYVSYLQHQKDLSDKALALGIVKDPKVSVL